MIGHCERDFTNDEFIIQYAKREGAEALPAFFAAECIQPPYRILIPILK